MTRTKKSPPENEDETSIRPPQGKTRGFLRSRVTNEQLRAVFAGRGLFGRFGYLVATQIVTVLIGVAYWTVSARLIPASRVGIAAAGMSAATLIAFIGVLGVSSVLLVALGSHEASEQRALVTTCTAIAAGVVAIITIGAWAISSLLGQSLGTIAHSVTDSLLVLFGALATTVAEIADNSALGLRKSPALLIRNTIASTFKVLFVVVLVAVGIRSTTGLLVGWDASLALSLLASPFLLRLSHGARVGFSRRSAMLKYYWRLSLGHHAVNLAIGSMTYVLPVVAAIFIIPKQVAYYSVAQLISGSALMLPYLLAMSLFVESSGDEELLRRNVRKTFPIGLLCCMAVIVILEPSANLVLSIFSHAYSLHGSTALRVLLLAGLPYVVKDHFVAIRRAQNRLSEAARIGVFSTSFEVLAAGLGAWMGGLDWLCAAWVISAGLEAVYFLPVVLRVVTSSPSAAVLGSENIKQL